MHRRLCFPTLVSLAFAAAGLLLVLTNSALAADVPLAWDPNNESDLLGYGIYYQKNAPGPPYLLFSYVTLAELADPSKPTIRVTGLDTGSQYYFAVTAFDTADNESSFSNSVCGAVGAVIIPCAADQGGGGGSGGDSSGGSGGGGGSGGDSSGGSGGGGGGCFIRAVSGEHDVFAPPLIELSLLWLLVFLRRIRHKAIKFIP